MLLFITGCFLTAFGIVTLILSFLEGDEGIFMASLLCFLFALMLGSPGYTHIQEQRKYNVLVCAPESSTYFDHDKQGIICVDSDGVGTYYPFPKPE